ncbi:MAG: cytidyltransferase [Oscillospiraceae bacterium]|nr:cytidyltransferase [Oscillospiraceae bacterium]
MRILAVIPARAGSKGIPNKNIRIISGHPLVYYAIRNAQKSELITDIVVTTDSPEVGIIARQMGIRVHWRKHDLCGDEITLDAVIADAIPGDESWDYIVTMQPTSPTLKPDTLDRAIQFALDHRLETLISVVNAPHLSWGVRDGRIVPNYEKRLNRQYLPPCYLETGAFVISAYSVVTPKSRIGSSVEVFEIPENEAQDVDNFNDLRSVEATLSGLSVAIYVNGNNQRGMGHVYRALELADEFFVKPDIFYDVNQTDPSVFGTTTHRLCPVNGIAELFQICRGRQYSIFINDILDTSIDYMIALRSALPNAKIINFEDAGEGIQKADLVFNALYERSAYPNVCAGEQYYICGKPFLFYRPISIKERVEHVLVSFGGSDPQNYTDRILAMVSKPEYSAYQFTVVLGKAKHNVEELMQYNSFPNIHVLFDVTNMPELMSACDMALTSRGRTSYELAILGIPTIVMAQNAREEKHGFVCNENGFSYIGREPSDEIIEGNLRMYLTTSQSSRQHFQNKLLKFDLRNGRKRVMSLINSL